MSLVLGKALSEVHKDRLLALLAAVFALTLIAAARGIEDSLLADAVGAGGVPQGVGAVMLLAALALFGNSFRAAPQDSIESETPHGPPWQALGRTAGLAVTLVAFGALLPWLGYAATVSLLVLVCGWLAGAALRAPLLLCAAATGPLLWALFDQALQVRMPVGSWWA